MRKMILRSTGMTKWWVKGCATLEVEGGAGGRDSLENTSQVSIGNLRNSGKDRPQEEIGPIWSKCFLPPVKYLDE